MKEEEGETDRQTDRQTETQREMMMMFRAQSTTRDIRDENKL